MSNLIFHPSTATSLKRVISQQPQAIALIGPEGSGKLTTARYIANELLVETRRTGENYFEVTPHENGVITIEQAREIKQLVRLKGAHSRGISRVITIQDAHVLQVPAQNSLLKLLEEPPQGTIFILTIAVKESILPTLRSRLTDVAIRPLLPDQLASLTSSTLPETQLAKIFHLSGGYAGIASILATTDSSHPLFEDIGIAKKILSSKRYTRLQLVDELVKDHQKVTRVILCVEKILDYKLKASMNLATAEKKRLCITAQDDLQRRVNRKLVLTDLFLKL